MINPHLRECVRCRQSALAGRVLVTGYAITDDIPPDWEWYCLVCREYGNIPYPDQESAELSAIQHLESGLCG